MRLFVKETDIEIVGTSERAPVMYPIRATEDGGWEYTGDSYTVYDECAEIAKDEKGRDLFQGEDGEEYPWEEIEARDE